MENIYQLLILLEQAIKQIRQRMDDASQIIGRLPSPLGGPVSPISEPLSAREKQVLNGLQRGLTPKQIAAELKISAKTVYIHRNKIRKKLGFQSLEQRLRDFPSSEA